MLIACLGVKTISRYTLTKVELALTKLIVEASAGAEILLKALRASKKLIELVLAWVLTLER